MLTSIYAKNYKAFEEISVKLRPITVLLGPNNTGKTSLTEILLMMQQTAYADEQDFKAPLKLNGRIVSMGPSEHLFHNKNTEEPIHFEFGFRSRELMNDLARMNRAFRRQLSSILRDYARYLYYSDKNADEIGLVNDLDLRSPLLSFGDEGSRESYLEIAKSVISTARKYRKQSDIEDLYGNREYDNYKALIKLQSWDDYDIFDVSLPDYLLSAQFIGNLEKRLNSDVAFSIRFGFIYSQQEPHLRLIRVCLYHDDNTLVDLKIDDSTYEVCSIDTSLIKNTNRLKNYYNSIANSISIDSTIFSCINNADVSACPYLISQAISKTLRHGIDRLYNHFVPSYISHVSPIRAYPRRFYLADQTNVEQLEGENYIEVLQGNEELTKKINKWLAKFGIKINIKRIREVLHRAAITQDGVEIDLDILDVGFGISQVLPVIIQAYILPKGATAIIEQPEIHLHPRMQADLMDLFIDIASAREIFGDETGSLIIETHSESLLRRLRSRLAHESCELATMVSLYSIEQEHEGISVAGSIEISEEGAFRWPRDFLEVTLNDTMCYLEGITDDEKGS